MKELITDRLILNGFTMNDIPDVYSYAKTDLVGPPAGWSPHKDMGETSEIVKNFIETDVFAIRSRDTCRVIGSLGLHDTSVSRAIRSLRGIELGYVLSPDYWGRGIMTEAASAAVRYAFYEMGIEIIWSGYFEGNERSRGVQEKLGMRECYIKFTEVMALNDTFVEHINFLTREMFEKAAAK